MKDKEIYSPFIFKRARLYFSFLVEHAQEDLEQVVALVRQLEKTNQVQNLRNICDKELYELAISLGRKKRDTIIDGKRYKRWIKCA